MEPKIAKFMAYPVAPSSISVEVRKGADDLRHVSEDEKSFPTSLNGEEIRIDEVEYSQWRASVEATSSHEPETIYSSYSSAGICIFKYDIFFSSNLVFCNCFKTRKNILYSGFNWELYIEWHICWHDDVFACCPKW